jgi:hypothetical protein
VSAFDRLNHTLTVLATIFSGFERNKIHRVLDDLPIVDRHDSDAGQKFCQNYTTLCNEIGVRLAPLCPNNIKAFEASTVGTVLGIRFHTHTLTWSLPLNKRNKIIAAAAEALSGVPMGLESMQILMGLLNDLAQMIPFLRGFRHNLNKFLSALLIDEANLLILPDNAARDLKVWLLAAYTAADGLPIPQPASRPLPSCHHLRLRCCGSTVR